MPVPTTTLQVAFVSESADFRNTFGWYNRATGYGGILFANVEAQGSNAPLTPGVSTANFTVNTADLANIAFFLVSDGYDLNRNDTDDFTGAVKVIQLANGTWAVADVDSHGNVKTDHGAPDILKGEGVNALFTETSKNAGHVDYASSAAGSGQTAATLTGDTADGPTGLLAWEDLAATRRSNGSYTKPGDADYNDAVFRISIVGGNHAPTANADAVTVGEDAGATAISVLGNDTDSDAGNVLHITSIATSGVVGTVAIAPGATGLTYTPPAAFQALAAGETATETFSYTAADQDGASSTANVTVTVIGANDAPLVAGAVSAAGSEGSGGFTVNLLAGASDIDHGAVLHVANLAWTDTGSGLPAGFTAAGNALTVDTSNAAYNAMAQGETFTTHFAYDVVDEHGASVRQTATVAITGANDAPVITGGDTTGSVQENTVNQTTGQLDAFDPDHGAVLSWAVQGGSASGSADYRFSADSFTVIRSGLLPTVTIAPPPGPVTEGGALAFTLTRTGDLSQALTVNLNTTFAGANNFDISAPSTAVFTPGTATTVVNVQALDDTFVEANQGFVLNIVPGPGYVSGVAFNASGTILDNDVAAPPTIPPAPVPTITIAATDGVGTEAIDGPDFTYTFTRTGDLSQALSVNYQIIGNPPHITNPADIVTPATPFVMFAPGSATATLSFDAVDDALVEGTETFSIGIAPGDGLSYAGFGTVNGIIIDNDGGALPSVTIAPPPGPVTEGGALAFTLTRTGDLSQALTVNLNTTFAGANNFDLSAPSTAVFAPGSATTVVNVQALDDTFVEPSQSFALNITTGPGYVSGAAFSASATILDNDVAPPPGPIPTITIAATDGVGTEAIDGPDFTYTFTRTGDLSQALSVNYSINGSPPNITNPADFVTPATPFVMFAPGSATATLSFDALDDGLAEGTESFFIGIAPGDGLSYNGFGTTTGIIIDNDGGALPTVTIASPPGPVTEGGALAFTLTRTGDLSQPLTVNLNASIGTANSFDFAAPGSVVFAAGSATAVANVQALDDTHAEASQSFVLNIVPGPGYVSGAAFSASGTILDNDVAPPPGPLSTITIAATDGVGTEAVDGPDFTYTFTRTGDLSQALSVNYLIIGNPPNITNPADLVATTPFVTFAPGSATAILSFDAVDDALAEGTESFSIAITQGDSPLNYSGFGTANGIIIDNDNAVTLPFFQDDFSDGVPPPSAPNFANGNPASYTGAGVNGFEESGGRLIFDSDHAVAFDGPGTDDPIVGQNAILRSNIDPASPAGLKSSESFTVSAVFDLILPDSPREAYGIRLTDRLVGGNGTPPDQPGDDVIELVVRETPSGQVVVALREVDFAADSTTNIQSIALAPPPGADQIRLNLAHSTSDVGAVVASFDYLAHGVVVGSQTLSQVGHIFGTETPGFTGDDENWTRAEIISYAPAQSDSVLSGVYGTLNINQAGTWTYNLDNTRVATQNLAQGETAAEHFTAQVADEFGATDTETITINVTGTNDAPIMQTAAVTRALTEGQSTPSLMATGLAQFADLDLTDTHTATATLQSTTASGGAVVSADLALALQTAMTAHMVDPSTGDGHGQLQWDYAVANGDVGYLNAGQAVTAVYSVAVTDPFGASAVETVTITLNGIDGDLIPI